jgi:serine/threonine protein kinase
VEAREGDRVVGRYVLEERVGAGGMGVVWRATDTVLDRVVALKQVRLGAVEPEEAEGVRQRVAREARVAAPVHHARAVTIFDVVSEHGEPWLVLEFLPSRSLEELLAERAILPVPEVARIGAAVAEALAAAHAAGVVHRDVKPGNVLVGAGDVVKLTDFGISRVVDEHKLTRTGFVVGTLA